MARSRLIIGVMGGGEQKRAAQRLGAAIVAGGHMVLTGGINQDSCEAKDAALFGAAEAAKQNGGVARLIGILKLGRPEWSPKIEGASRSLFLYTGLQSAERDCITGTTPDGLIFLRGSTGTLTEAAFAHSVGRPVIFLSARDWLTKKARAHREKGLFGVGGGDGKLGEYFSEAGAVYAKCTGRSFSIEQLELALKDCLAHGEELPEDKEREAVHRIVAKILEAGRATENGFPGLPHDPQGTRQLFNEAVNTLDESHSIERRELC